MNTNLINKKRRDELIKYQKYQHICRLGTQETEGLLDGECVIMPKLDGTNGTLFLGDDGLVHAGSRNRELDQFKDNQGFYNRFTKDERFIEYFKKYPTRRLYGEYAKPHSLRTYIDDVWNKFWVFDVCEQFDNEIRYLPYDEYVDSLKEFNIDFIPVITKINNPTYEQLVDIINHNNWMIQDGKGVGEGCFKGDTNILMADGSQKHISKIKVGDLVKSYNIKSNTIENKRVLNVYYNGKKELDKWLNLAVFSKGCSSKDLINGNFFVTKNHKFFDGTGFSSVENIDYVYHYGLVFDKFRKQAFLGLMVSDMCFHKKEGTFSLSQSSNKVDDFKNLFSNFIVSEKNRISGKGKEVSNLWFQKQKVIYFYDTYIYDGEINYIKIFRELDDIGWSFFFMGDGYGDKHGEIELSLSSYSIKECEMIMSLFNKYFDVNAKLSYDNRVVNGSGGRLRTGRSDGLKIMKIMSKYIMPNYRYKIKALENPESFIGIPEVTYGITKRKLYSKREVKTLSNYKKYSNINAYDIEVEDNHNYFANGCLVHNCVIKNYNYINKYGRITWGKLISSEFNNGSNNKGKVKSDNSKSNIEEKIVKRYLTEFVVDKEYSKIINENPDIEKRVLIPRLLNVCYYTLITEETWNFIKDFKNPVVDFKKIFKEVRNTVIKCKPDLFTK